MKRIYLFSALLMSLFVGGMVFSQSNPPQPAPSLEVVAELGRALPQGILYDANFERLAVVDAYGRFVLMDAKTYETQFVLHEQGNYNDFAFSHDGRWLALAVGTDMELWNTQTGRLVSILKDPAQAIQVLGPLTFSRNDNLLLFNGLHPAPQSLRRTENDTSITPWIWNLTAARNEGLSTFPRKVEAWQFFDYRNGFVLGPDDRIVAALPGRLHVIDANTLQVLFEIRTDRYEQDPLSVWFSLRDNKIYVQPVYQNNLIQVDTQRGVLVELPLDKNLTRNDLETVGGVELSQQARVIGESNSLNRSPLVNVLLGSDYDYRELWKSHRLTITLLDVITPPVSNEDRIEVLLFIYDEQDQIGRFVVTNPPGVSQMVLNPDDEHLIVRRMTNAGEQIEIYNITSGQLESSLVPALRDIGGYSRQAKNRVLGYDKNGKVIISDFQRFDAATGNVLAEDLRYSQRFDRFFFTADSKSVVTVSGDEWRLWDITGGKVLKRQVLPLQGSIIATSPDGYRFLTQFTTLSGNVGVATYDVTTGKQRQLTFEQLRGRSIEDIIPSPDWEHYFVIYSANSWGAYAPGNEVAIYSLDKGMLWFVAGDDLPLPQSRQYGWVNNDTAYVYGEGSTGDQPERVFGADFAADSTPECLIQKYPAQQAQIGEAWYQATLKLRGDDVAKLANLICDEIRSAPANAPVPTLSANAVLATATPPVIAGIPACLTARYPNDALGYAEEWRKITAGLSPEQVAQTEQLICEGIGTPQPRRGDTGNYQVLTMMIDAASGVRSSGSYIAPGNMRPLQPILDEYRRTTKRALGSVILSPDEQLLASSSLPGELIIFRLVTPYQTLLANGTATSAAKYQAENRIAALPTYTPTFSVIGTARPTLTPTVTPTPPPKPQQEVAQAQRGQTQHYCPSEKLYSMDAPPSGYSPVGRILAPVQGNTLWTIAPQSGKRVPDDTIPKCAVGVQCSFSPDSRWILAEDVNTIYVVRPDGSDERLLFDKTKPYPGDLHWSGAKTLEYTVYGKIPGSNRYDNLIQRDILGVFPDPDPWWPHITIHDVNAELISLQPGGPLAVARTTFSTGVNPGYAYYIYNTQTGEATYFVRLSEYPEQDLDVFWHPSGDRFFYAYPQPPNTKRVWYQFTPATGSFQRLGDLDDGAWSQDGRYTAYSTGRRTQQVGVWDSQTGLTRTYCVPETGARTYDGSFYWSPDSHYLALQAPLPKDESQKGVGQHTLILDLETGSVTDLAAGLGDIVVWTLDAGSFAKGD